MLCEDLTTMLLSLLFIRPGRGGDLDRAVLSPLLFGCCVPQNDATTGLAASKDARHREIDEDWDLLLGRVRLA
eukprot:6208257-Pleurochrysis_carterae.AAC.2